MIKKIHDYEEDEIHSLRQISPATNRYLELLKNSSSSSFDARIKTQRLGSWVEAALATYHQSAPPRDVCKSWSLAADQMIRSVSEVLGLTEKGLAIFALGKLGANELNLSSDIDLVILSKEAPTQEMTKLTRDFVKIISSTTEFGSGFRVDLDLRPGGFGSPLVCNLGRFQDYYWTQSELWERMALVRMREICGPKELIAETLEARDQFCYRKYLDYSLLEELKRLRPKIHATAGKFSRPDSINLKLTPGYIRDIELFINAHQIIYGGKEKKLRTTSTDLAANQLGVFEKNPGLFKELLNIYWKYRQWENQVQAVNDFQTHDLDLKNKPKGWSWPSETTLLEMSDFVDDSISDLLGPATKPDPKESDSEILSDEKLRELGFSEDSIQLVWPEVKKASVLSRQKNVDEMKRSEVILQFVNEISNSAFDKDLGMKGLRDFLNSIRAKATFFHLLSKEQKLVKDLSFLFGLSPYLGSLFSTRPELVDSFLFNRDEPFSLDMEKALVQMAERKRLAEIRSALAFLSQLELESLTLTLSQTADAISIHLLEIIKRETNTEDIYLLALGKWGGYELGFKSDLDFLFVSPNAPSEDHHRLVRRFISRMRDTSAGGSIYSIDTRLRPSGKGGALIVQESQLVNFLRSKASPWERQAYLKGRWINRDVHFQDLLNFNRGLTREDLSELKSIRDKLITRETTQEISLKLGEGGILDIELGLQTLILDSKTATDGGSTANFFKALNMEKSFLFKHYFNLRKLEQIIRILSVESDPKLSAAKPFLPLAARILSREPEELLDSLRKDMKQAALEIKNIDPTFS